MLLRRHHVVLVEGGGEVTPAGERFLGGLGVDLPTARGAKRHYCRGGVDGTERRHHISGAVGAALAETFLARRLVARIPDSRALSVTPLGRKTLAALGVAEYRTVAPRSASAGSLPPTPASRPVIDFHHDDPGRMLKLCGEEERGVTAIDRLNELLEAERAGVDTLSRLCPEARSPEMQKLFEEVRNDEAWSCAGLVRSIKAMGGTMSEKKGDFAEKVMSEPTLAARLRLLNRGQGWVVKRLDNLLGETLPASVGVFLEEMKARHITNIEACERLAESLKAA